MNEKINRRQFLKDGAILCAGCVFLQSGDSRASLSKFTDDELIVPEKFTYCGFICRPECKMYKATLENDIGLKKKAYELWGWKEKHNIDFDPDLVFCHTCKPGDKPVNVFMQKCGVRNCAIENKLQSCIECDELKKCEQSLWTQFPEHKLDVIELRKKYLKQLESKK